MAIDSVFITGSNRGIGLEFVKQFLSSPSPPKVIFAACRNPEKAQELKHLKESSPQTAIHIVKLEVIDEDEIKAAAAYVTQVLGDDGLTLLINNAGILENTPFPGTSAQTYIKHFQINTLAPILISENFLPLLKKSAAKKQGSSLSCERAAIINITGLIAAFSHVDVNIGRELEAYRITKTALNSASAIMSRNLKESGILVVALHPGWVETDMGGKGADLTVSQSIDHMMKTIKVIGEGQAGRMINYDGKVLDW